MPLRTSVIGPFAACLVTAAAAHAQTPSNKVTAEALFEDGRRLMAEGNYADACPKFAASERIDPSPATLLNLASCFEKQGRTATAWATYKEAASAANAAGRRDYLATAERHASSLSPGLSRLTLNIAHPFDGLRVERDGVVVERAEWGIGIPVDPGLHSVAATATGYKSWTSTVTVTQGAAQQTVVVPPLEAAPEPASPPTPAPMPAPTPALAPAAQSAEADTAHAGTSTQKIMAWVVAGAGVAGLAVGTVFAVNAKNKYSDTLSECLPNNPNLCSSSGVSDRNDARSMGDVATLAFGLGAAAVVAGGVLWLTAPGSAKRSTSLVVTPTLGGASLRGAW
jgi:hypothetical protein